MTIGFLILFLAVCLCDSMESSNTLFKIRCHGDGKKETSCHVPKAKKMDISNLEVDLVCQKPPNGCGEGKFRLEMKGRKIFLIVSKDCKGLFSVKNSSSESECGVGNVPAPATSGFRIINGRKATSCSQFPWMVSLSLSCGATIIDKKHLLTAAHCLQPPRVPNPKILSPVAVYIGIYERKIFTSPHVFIDKYFIHEDFNDKSLPPFAGDIAVIRLTKELKFGDCVKPICLESIAGNIQNVKSDNCHISGWGKTQNTYLPKFLSWVPIGITDESTCRSIFGKDLYSGGSFCASAADKSSVGGACDGDSGDPLACKKGKQWYQYGVVSAKKTKADCGGVPGLYTSVPHYYEWIKTKINSP